MKRLIRWLYVTFCEEDEIVKDAGKMADEILDRIGRYDDSRECQRERRILVTYLLNLTKFTDCTMRDTICEK